MFRFFLGMSMVQKVLLIVFITQLMSNILVYLKFNEWREHIWHERIGMLEKYPDCKHWVDLSRERNKIRR